MKCRFSLLFILVFALILSACSANGASFQGAPSPSPSSSASTTEKPAESPKASADPSASPSLSPSPSPSALEDVGQQSFVSPFKFTYPDAVRGIYVTAYSAGGDRMSKLVNLVDTTDLNAMVIDIKDDDGYITYKLHGTSMDDLSQPFIKDPKVLLQLLQKHNIYPIARIVSFKDSVYAKKHPELSYVENGHVWRNGSGASFINPFLKASWDHNVDIAKLAAEIGFQEIQFDYVRFPEGFERKDTTLSYSMGDYKTKEPTKFIAEKLQYNADVKTYEASVADFKAKVDEAQKTSDTDKTPTAKTALDDAKKNLAAAEKNKPKQPDFSEKERRTQLRVDAVTDFVAYAKNQLKPYGLKMSVDIFGYSATLPEAPGIGQNFSRISENVDAISSMIYPSHWSNGYFNIPRPDKEPYRLVKEYMIREKQVFSKLKNVPISRPWIQDFTASWLGSGNYIRYGKAEVDAQIKALKEAGVNEYLIWNAGNVYSPGVAYKQ